MFGSVVVEETLKQILSAALSNKDHEAGRSDETEHVERLEMAQLRLEAVLDASVGWPIKHPSLLRWRRKLKRAAQECDEALHRCKQRIEKQHSSSTFPRRLADATKACLSAVIGHHRDGSSSSTTSSRDDARRFERFADGASEFLRFVELGGAPWRRYTFFDPLIGRLLAGDEARYRLVRGSQYYLFCVRPIVLEGRGTEAKLDFFYEDDDAPEKNLCIGTMLRLSESTDIVGVTIRCLQLLVTPHFRSTSEAAARELANLPTQDFSWVHYGGGGGGGGSSTHRHRDREHWDSIHRDMSQWFRPDPLCCNHNQHELWRPSSSSQVSLESVIQVYWQCQVPMSEYNNMLQRNRNAAAVEEFQGPAAASSSSEDTPPYLTLGLLFTPHGSLGDLTPRAESSALEVIDGEEQRGTHTNLSLQQLDETMLPKALQCLYQKTEAMAYQMLWKSRHGAAYLHVRKTTTPRKNWTGDDENNGLLMQRNHQDPKLERWKHVLTSFLNLWVPRVPDDRLRSSMTEWLQRASEKQLAVSRS